MKLTDAWYDKNVRWPLLLKPLESLYIYLSKSQKRKKLQHQWLPPCPLIVVGNISVGGTGKSPLTIELIDVLQRKGYKVGVVSRGYKANIESFPHQVTANDDTALVGDEPLMIVKRTQVNLVIDPDRVSACRYLLVNNDCDVIISDDGLQHYAMGRDIEICVVDSARGVGNGHCMPVGPLREPPARLKTVDYIILNGADNQNKNAGNWSNQEGLAPCFTMQLKPIEWQQLKTQQAFSFDQFNQLVTENSYQVTAFAGIGNPQRFFNSVEQLGVSANTQNYADHYQYSEQDFTQLNDKSVLCMTEKDAVKCENYVPAQSYYLKIAAQLEPEFIGQLCDQLEKIAKQKCSQ
jgi:tetraacyldisaccharide 4'-kinase